MHLGLFNKLFSSLCFCFYYCSVNIRSFIVFSLILFCSLASFSVFISRFIFVVVFCFMYVFIVVALLICCIVCVWFDIVIIELFSWTYSLCGFCHSPHTISQLFPFYITTRQERTQTEKRNGAYLLFMWRTNEAQVAVAVTYRFFFLSILLLFMAAFVHNCSCTHFRRI